MIVFNKKEIQGFLKNLSKDETRPALCDVYVDTKNKNLVATDGYTMVVIAVDWDKKFKDIESTSYSGYYIPAKTLSDWCKLHKTKDTITSDELAEMVELKDYKYPDYERLFTNFEKMEKVSSNKFDMSLMSRFSDIIPNALITFKDGEALLNNFSPNGSTRKGLICGFE